MLGTLLLLQNFNVKVNINCYVLCIPFFFTAKHCTRFYNLHIICIANCEVKINVERNRKGANPKHRDAR